MIVQISERRALAFELLELSKKVAADVAAIEEKKDALKKIAATRGGFTEGFADGIVIVKAEGSPKFKGILPVLDAELFLASDAQEQARLKTAGLVRDEAQYGRAAYASVTVKLANA